MSDQGEKTCPLCAEEMDLTDQHLKPCKCGYEICVWCWHHIMDIAEKNGSEGRCPACRSPYNKEKIVGTASNCERLVAEMNTEKKLKSNKSKSKTSEVRKQLSSVRVIQKNLVYLVGLPLNLADEDLLQRKEYFGQYGKVLKVSISRTTTGAIQQFANDTCSVYITYSKEEEAICCIQSVHEFLLDGRQLRACFGTTKYCHAWLRNMPCSNPECMYLHEFGSEEDRFSKDEIVSAFSRSRVQQVTGGTNSAQRRFGNVLPPPADDYCSNGCASTGKLNSKNATLNCGCSSASQNTPCILKISPPNSRSGRSVALPAGASWATPASNNQQTSGNLLPSNGLQKQKVDSFKGPVAFPAALASSNHVTSPNNDGGKEHYLTHEETKPTLKNEHAVSESQTHASDLHGSPGQTSSISSKVDVSSTSKNNYKDYSLPSDISSSVKPSLESCGVRPAGDQKYDLDEKVKDARSSISSMRLAENQGPADCRDGYQEPAMSAEVPATTGNEVSAAAVMSYIRPDPKTSIVEAALSQDKTEMLSFDDERVDDPEVTSNGIYLTGLLHTPSSSKIRDHSEQCNGLSNVKENTQIVDKRANSISQSFSTPVLFSGCHEYESSVASSTKNIEDPYLSSSDHRTMNMRRFGSEGTSVGCNNASDMGENTLISDILSLDFDSLDESLSSQNFANLFGETDKKQGSLKLSTPWKSQHSNQSRFSFAREEESMNPAPHFESHVNHIDPAPRPRSFVHDLTNSTNYNNFGSQNAFSLVNGEEHNLYNHNHSRSSSDNLAVSRPQIAAPPGFSTPRRAPPPGFTSYEKVEQQTAHSLYGNYSMDAFSLPSHQYQISQAGNVGSHGDVEFIDPAIMAVGGKGRLPDGFVDVGMDLRSRFSPQFNAFENNSRPQLLTPRPQLLTPRSHPSLQNQGYEIGDRFSSLSDSFRIPSRVVEQSIVHNMSPYSGVAIPQSRSTLSSNGHWDSWKDVQNGNNLGMADLLRAERLGFNKFHSGYEDSAFRMSSQGDLYNRTFGF